MKRTHSSAFQEDALQKLPKECEDIVFAYLSVTELCQTVAPASSRLRAIAYQSKYWRNLRILGMQNQRALEILRLHGRKMQQLTCYGMRISRALCQRFTKCSALQSLDLTGIWKSTAIDKRFVSAITLLPLKQLLFGHNEVCDEGFTLLCNNLSGLEELDFNSRKVSSRALYNLCMLTNLTSLCLRSCAHANEDTVRSICRLQKLKTLQLSFLPMLHCTSLRHLYCNGIVNRLQTLVLNGMYLDRDSLRKLSLFRKLRVLSVCHPKISSTDLERVSIPSLELLTIFCSNEMYCFDFLSNFPSLKTLCLYRCACSNTSLMQWAGRRPMLEFRLFAPRALRQGGEPRPDKTLNYKAYANLKELRLMRRPYPVFL